MNTQMPFVSIIIPTKNSAQFLKFCLDSIRKQTYEWLEIIVVDNFSTDKTEQVARKYTNKFFLKGPERSTQRNYGVEKSSGKYVFIIDSDMELTEQVVESCVELIKNNNTVRAVIVPELSIGNGFWSRCKSLERSFYLGVDWLEAARFYDKKLYIELNGYNEKLISGEDWDLSQRARLKTKIERIDKDILHNEGQLKLINSLRKKYYYAQHISKYIDTNDDKAFINTQMSPLSRYKLFFTNPKKLMENPLVGIGMIFMKTLEYIVGGVGFFRAKF